MATTVTCNLTDSAHGGGVLTTASGGRSSRTLGINATAYSVSIDFYGYGGYDGKSHTYALGFDKDAYSASAGTTFEKTVSFTKTLNDGSPSSDKYQFLGTVEYSNSSGFSNFRIGVDSHTSTSGGQLVISRCVVTYSTDFTLTVKAGNYIKSVTGGGSYAPGKKVNISATLDSADYYNYSFSKWTSNNGGTFGSATSATTTFTMPSANVTITATGTRAVWQHTVQFDANGGSGAPSSIVKKAYEVPSLPTGIPTKTGYTFVNWNTAKDGSGTPYTSGGQYGYDKNGGTVTLYAQWSENYIQLNFYPNGASQSSGQASDYPLTNGYYSRKYYYDNDYSTNGILNVGTVYTAPTGYYIAEATSWNTKADGTGTNINHNTGYSSGQAIAQVFSKTLVSSNQTVNLYANWQPYKLTVIYNANGGTQTNNNYPLPYQTSAFYGTNFNGTNGLGDISTFGLVRTDYKIIAGEEWNTKADGTGITLSQSTSYTAQALAKALGSSIDSSNATVNVYANWVLIQKEGFIVIYSTTGKDSYRPYIFNGTSWEPYSAHYYDGGWQKTNIKATSVDN